MAVPEIISFLSQKVDLSQLHSDPLFSIALLKILGNPTKELLFCLLTTNLNIKNLNTNDDKQNKEIITNLRILYLLKLIQKNNGFILLDNNFRSGFVASMKLVRVNNYFEAVSCTNTADTVSFDNILRMLVNDRNAKVNEVVLDVLQYAKLVNIIKEITHSGFEFLLKSRKEQMWFLILNGILMLGKNYVDWLTMIVFEMGMYERHCWLKINESKIFGTARKHNKNTNIDPVSDKEAHSVLVRLLKYLSYLGIIQYSNDMVKPTAEYFLLFSSAAIQDSFLIVETNYKLYAYTTSSHELSIIKLFSQIVRELPNLVTAHITEESVNAAFLKGITGQQIVDYLTEKSKSELPPVVLEQILIWERQRDRMKCIDAVIYSHFMTYNEYEITYRYCREKGALIDHDEFRRLLVVRLECHNEVKNFIKNNIK
ncbi:RNA polymerase II transcription initiation/nucleotide excision repair factor TFIIH, subunit TFB2 [Trachipleistophora hominis]|uniref:RNA polymerase II transcription factor B subunit 2 n=1 Tax=Trachipleistophora hominis TaxID=72359 RepID=L7JY69_TRAHO|nr:RNA polymerase II transcription initiation/nucleotide excision repair factor TFIIH, subunit TFB2 [Trachipleistophora hominis]